MERKDNIEIIGAAENNLKHVDVIIPKGILTAVTGVAGSGNGAIDFLHRAFDESKEQSRQVAQSIDDDTWSILLQLHVYADNGNVLKDVVWRQRPRRKACSCCMVCVFSSCRDTIFSSFQKDEIRA